MHKIALLETTSTFHCLEESSSQACFQDTIFGGNNIRNRHNQTGQVQQNKCFGYLDRSIEHGGRLCSMNGTQLHAIIGKSDLDQEVTSSDVLCPPCE